MKSSPLAFTFLVLLSSLALPKVSAQIASPTPMASPSATPKPSRRTTTRTKVIVRKGTVIRRNARNKPMPSPTPSANPALGATAAPVAPAAPPPPPNPFKLVFYAEYQGPRLSNIDFTKTEDDTGAVSSAVIASFTQIGYGVSKDVVLGARIRYSYGVDPSATTGPFAWANQRLYAAWSNMIDTKDLNVSGQVDFELPTTDASRTAGLILAINLKNNWTLKTSLRNWSFSALTVVRPMFYNNIAATNNDVSIEIDPDIVVDLSANWQFQIEGYFAATHAAQVDYFDYNNTGNSDTIDIGPLWNISAHYSLYPALRFYTGDLSPNSANFYINFTAAL